MTTGRSPGARGRGRLAPHGHVGVTGRPTDLSDHGRRSLSAAAPVPDGKGRCEVCLKVVPIKKNGKLQGHQASKGISCLGGNPTC